MWERLKHKVSKGFPLWSDSREVKGEGIFVVSKENYRFLRDALERGATHIVVDRTVYPLVSSLLQDRETIVVDNAHHVLGELARLHYGSGNNHVVFIGITGTNGKTTVSYILEHLFKEQGRKVGVVGTVNYRWGEKSIPSSLTTPGCLKLHSIVGKMVQEGVEVVIMEVSSHGLTQDRVAGFSFDVGIFTNLSHDHLDYHRDMEDYFNAKKRLFSHYLKEYGLAIVNMEDQYGLRLLEEGMEKYRTIGFGFNPIEGIEMVLGEITYMGREGMRLRSSFRGDVWELYLPLIGKHNALNFLAVEGAALGLGISPREFRVLEDIKQVPGRLERIDNPMNYDIFVDYAHTPDALEKVLSSLRNMHFDRLIVVFGCGGDRDRAKRPLMGKVVCAYADIAVLTSDNPRFEAPEKIIEEVYEGMNGIEIIKEVDRKQAIEKALSIMDRGDVLIIAGKGHEDYQEIKGKRYPFSDKKIVEEYFSR